MPDTFISRVNELSCNEPNQFIFTDRSGCHFGDINITGVDRDAADIKNNQAPQDPPHKFQATEEAEEEPVITYPNIGLNINHETPIEQIQAPKEPPKDTITVTFQPTTITEDTNRPDHPRTVICRSDIVRTHTKSYIPSMAGNCYAYFSVQISEQEFLHPDSHVLFNNGSFQN